MSELNVTVDYIAHSGFTVEINDKILVFDYYRGDLNIRDKDKNIYVFSSHNHKDHFNPSILDWRKDFDKIHYILSNDIEVEEAEDISFMAAYKEKTIDDVEVRTFGSTDKGVSFLVSLDGVNIFHAGDLHWWYWNHDKEVEKIDMENSFKIKIKRIKESNLDIDIAFFPVDPRLEENFHLGGEYFINEIKPKYFFPMHSWGKYEIIEDFIQQLASPSTKIMEIKGKNQIFDL